MFGKFLIYLVAAIVVIFAIVNRGPATLSMWPFPFEVTVPLFAALLSAVAIGVVLGGVGAQIAARRRERRARKADPPKPPPAAPRAAVAEPPVARRALPATLRTQRALIDD